MPTHEAAKAAGAFWVATTILAISNVIFNPAHSELQLTITVIAIPAIIALVVFFWHIGADYIQSIFSHPKRKSDAKNY